MSKQKPKDIKDVKFNQKDVEDFFNSIHTDALVDSIKMSYSSTLKVKIIEEIPSHAPTWKDIEKDNITHHYTLEEEANELKKRDDVAVDLDKAIIKEVEQDD